MSAPTIHSDHLWNSFTAEMDKSLRRPAIWVLIAVGTTLSVVFNYVVPYVTYATAGDVSAAAQREALAVLLPGQWLPAIISGFPLFASAIALVLGAIMMGSEFNWETFKTVLVQRPGRKHVLSGTFLTLAVAVFVFVLAVFVAGATCSAVVAMIESAPMNWPPIGEFLLVVVAGWFILFVWAAFGAMLATLSRGTSLAIGLGLVYLLAAEGLIAFAAQSSELIATLWRVLPRANAGSIAAALVPSGISAPGVEAAVGPVQATLVVAVYLIGFVLVTGTFFLKRDVT